MYNIFLYIYIYMYIDLIYLIYIYIFDHLIPQMEVTEALKRSLTWVLSRRHDLKNLVLYI